MADNSDWIWPIASRKMFQANLRLCGKKKPRQRQSNTVHRNIATSLSSGIFTAALPNRGHSHEH